MKKIILISFSSLIVFLLVIFYISLKEDPSVQVQKAINQGDHKTIEKFLADTVRIEIDGTECCGDLTRVAALEQLKFGKIKYDFDQNNERIKKMKINFPNYFKEHHIGLGENGNNMSYRFNAEEKIDFISSFYEAVESTNEKAVKTE